MKEIACHEGQLSQAEPQLSFEDAVQVWPRIWRGEFLNRIASDLDVNPGRIAEIKKGYRFEGSREVALRRQTH